MMIRKANRLDARAIAQISSDVLGYPCTAAFVAERLEQVDAQQEVVFVAEVDDQVVGYLHAQIYRTLYMDAMVNLLGLAVLEAMQKKGIGRALLEHAEQWAMEHGIFWMRLNSGATRTGAHAFYRTMGYTEEKQQIRFLKQLHS
jgi:GNAT superfamily N-acetyltransferase